nr:tetratricopeptide repeat protein [Chitinophagaceae bacterium]
CFENATKLLVNTASNSSIESYLQKAKDYHLILNEYLNYVDKKLEQIASTNDNIRNALSTQCTTWAKWLCNKKKKSFQKIAFNFFHKALLYNPENIKIYIDKAQLLKGLKNTKEAKQLLEQALKIAPENPEIIVGIRDLSMDNKDYDDAIQYALKYIEIVGENASGYGNQSHILYGYVANAYYAKANELLYTQHLYVQAEELYDKVVDLYPKLSADWKKFEGPWVGKSDAQSYQKKHTEALAYANEAVAMNNTSAYAWSAKGSCLNNLGKYEEALTCCDKAIKLKPDYFHPWYVKGCVYALTGGKGEALEMIKKTITIDPTKKEQISKEPDFKCLYQDKEFLKLIAS